MPRSPEHERAIWPEPAGAPEVRRGIRVGPSLVPQLDGSWSSEPASGAELFLVGHLALDAEDEPARDPATEARDAEALFPRGRGGGEVPPDADSLRAFAAEHGRVGSTMAAIGWLEDERGRLRSAEDGGLPVGEPVADLLFELSALRLARDLDEALAAGRGDFATFLERGDARSWRLRDRAFDGAADPASRFRHPARVLGPKAPVGRAPGPEPDTGPLRLDDAGTLRGVEVAVGSARDAARELLLSVVGHAFEAASRYVWLRDAGDERPDLVRVFDSPLACLWWRIARGLSRGKPPRSCARCGRVFYESLRAKGPPARTCSDACQRAYLRERTEAKVKIPPGTKARRTKG